MTLRTLPNFVIAGVNKAGTTSLFMYLKAHPDVRASIVKETCYFLPARYGQPVPPLKEYEKFFEPAETRYLMEGTPGYFYGGRRLAQHIQQSLDRPKILIMFREPIGRLFSFYKFMKSRQQIDPKVNFADYVRMCEACPPDQRVLQENNYLWGIEGGFYDQYLPDWVDVFGPDLKVIFFDDLMKSPLGCMHDICAWLGIDGDWYDTFQFETENRSVSYRSGGLQKLALKLNDSAELFWRRYPGLKHSLRSMYYKINGQEFDDTIQPDVRLHLEQVFRPHNQRLLEQLSALGFVNLPAWLAN